jgi:hypothetical protein
MNHTNNQDHFLMLEQKSSTLMHSVWAEVMSSSPWPGKLKMHSYAIPQNFADKIRKIPHFVLIDKHYLNLPL